MKEKIKKVLYKIANVLLNITISLTGLLLVIVIGFFILISIKGRGNWIKKPRFEPPNLTSKEIDKRFNEVYKEIDENAKKN